MIIHHNFSSIFAYHWSNSTSNWVNYIPPEKANGLNKIMINQAVTDRTICRSLSQASGK